MRAGDQARGAGAGDPRRDEAARRDTDEEERARRYLDLWERNLSFLSLNGPVPRMPRRGQ